MAKLLAEHLAATPRAGAGGAGLIEAVEDIEHKKLHVEDEVVAHFKEEEEQEAVSGDSKLKGALISAEERETGAVGGAVYSKYIRSMRGVWVCLNLPSLQKDTC